MASQGAHPACLFLTLTLMVTAAATAILVTAIITTHWEEVSFDKTLTEGITASKNSTHKLTWLMNGRVGKVEILQATPSYTQKLMMQSSYITNDPWRMKASEMHRARRQTSRVIFLVPLHGGIWTLCVGLEEAEQNVLNRMGYPLRGCINFLATEGADGAAETNEWIQRMQNLSISCSLVCCILLGASALVGSFGIIKRQISAVLITGVMYILATTFGLFCLSIMHFKRKTKRECGLVDSQMTLEYASARVFENGWSLEMGWGGVVACLGAALLWLLLAKIMRSKYFGGPITEALTY